MKKMLVTGAMAALGGCATVPTNLDICRGSELRRSVYTSAIMAADTYIASGRPVPPALSLSREAAVTALAVLDGNCPIPKSS